MSTSPTSSRDNPLLVESFSRDYVLVHGVDVIPCPSCQSAEMEVGLLQALEHHLGSDVVGKVGNTHYEFRATESIPAETVAIPQDTADDNQLLLLK